MKKGRGWVVTFVLMVLMAAPGWHAEGQTPDPAGIVKGVKGVLDKLETLQCSFEQSYYRAADARTIIREGTLALKKPNRFRVEDDTKTVVTNGKVVWMYVPENRQVQISAFSNENEDFPSPAGIFEKYASKRKAGYVGVDSVDDRICDVIVLPAPKPDENEVKVWVDRKLSFPLKTLETSPNGDTVQYTVHDLRMNAPLNNSVFTFVPPAGVETIDMRGD